MRPPGFAEPALQDLILGVKKNDRRVDAFFDRCVDLWKATEFLSFPDVDGECRALVALRIERKIRKFWHERNRKIVHSVEAAIFEGFECRELSRAARARYDDQIRYGSGLWRCCRNLNLLDRFRH